MEKVLITGVAGEIGYSMCERLIDEGFDVYGIDLPEMLKGERFDMIGRNALFHFIPRRLEDVDWDSLGDVDTIYHFAQSNPASNRLSDMKEWIASVQKNLKSVVEYGSTHSAKIIGLSTIEVYGHTHSRITDETIARPSSLYGTLMLTMENFLAKQSTEQGVPYIILRIPTIYGVPNRLEEHCRNIDRVEQESTHKQNQIYLKGHGLRNQQLIELLFAAGKADALNGIVPVPVHHPDHPSYTIESSKFAELSVHL